MKNNLTGIIISAGLSGRMNEFKPLLKLNNGKTFIQNIVYKLSFICNKVIVVTGFNSEIITEHLKSDCESSNIIFTFNKDFKTGMFTSLQTALRASDSQWYLYHFVDQPTLPNIFYNDFINQIDNSINWVQPVFKNRKGHPILFDKVIKKKILESNINNNLREISKDKSINKKFWECDTELIFQDIDTDDDYKLLD